MHTVTTPAVYVGTYHKYNCGSLAGQWLDVTDFDDEAEFYAACRALHADEAEPELMFQDNEGFPSDMASECHINWAFVEAYKSAEENHQAAAWLAWVDYTGECDFDRFEAAYCGEAEDEEEYAREYADSTGMLSEVPQSLRDYFDFERFACDLFSSDRFFSNGHVFYAC